MKNKFIYSPAEWITHFEQSNFLSSPSYKDTMEYFEKFEKYTHYAKLISFGISPKGRELKCLIASKDNCFTPKHAKRKNKAVVLIQNGIHSGEIEGKDAWMILLREILITKEKNSLLDNLVLIVIPILNVDGHERKSIFNRPNQVGPMEMGWRTTSQNLNLNRDYMKADSSEMKALLNLYNFWKPDFVIDNHTTNGVDYQYHITYGMEIHSNIDSNLKKFAQEKFLPFVLSKVEFDGFITAPYIEMKGDKIEEGIIVQPSLPRFSTGYCALQNRLCLLVETHSLKTFENRVLSTKSMNQSVIEFMNNNHSEIKSLNKRADKEAVKKYCLQKKLFPITFEAKPEFDLMNFKGFETYEEESIITGNKVIRYTQNKIEFEIPVFNKAKIKYKVIAPFAYAVPVEFNNIVKILKLHGIKIVQLKNELSLAVEKYKLVNIEFAVKSYEGRQRVDFDILPFNEKIILPKNTFIVFTNQKPIRIILHLLEPLSEDSFIQWGFFNSFFERKEYAEEFIFEPIAKKMLDESKQLSEEFFNLLNEDEEFNNSPFQRLDFFYKQSSYFDKAENIYPICRIIEKFKIE